MALIKILLLIFIQLTYGQKISDQMCQAYSKAVYEEADEPFEEIIGQASKNVSSCAIFENPLIVGGIRAGPKEFPHMAVIGFGKTSDKELHWICGASLISEKHALTAAHCSTSDRGPPRMVKLGATALNETGDHVQEIPIANFFIHPKYQNPIKYHDIAIIFLGHKVRFSAYVRPACLNTNMAYDLHAISAIGFGSTSYDSFVSSNILLKVYLDYIPKNICKSLIQLAKYETPDGLIDEMLCFGNLTGGKDTCQGDSGGPLQIVLDNPYCMYSIIGIVSFGQFCGMPNMPAIYTNVIMYVSWIEETIWKN